MHTNDINFQYVSDILVNLPIFLDNKLEIHKTYSPLNGLGMPYFHANCLCHVTELAPPSIVVWS